MRFAVPGGPQCRVADSVIGRQVNHPRAGGQQLRHHVHRHIVRRGEKHHIAGGQCLHIGLGKRQLVVTAQIGEQIVHPPATLRARGDRHHLRFFVQRQQPQQFHPGVTGPAYNSYLNHDAIQTRTELCSL